MPSSANHGKQRQPFKGFAKRKLSATNIRTHQNRYENNGLSWTYYVVLFLPVGKGNRGQTTAMDHCYYWQDWPICEMAGKPTSSRRHGRSNLITSPPLLINLNRVAFETRPGHPIGSHRWFIREDFKFHAHPQSISNGIWIFISVSDIDNYSKKVNKIGPCFLNGFGYDWMDVLTMNDGWFIFKFQAMSLKC